MRVSFSELPSEYPLIRFPNGLLTLTVRVKKPWTLWSWQVNCMLTNQKQLETTTKVNSLSQSVMKPSVDRFCTKNVFVCFFWSYFNATFIYLLCFQVILISIDQMHELWSFQPWEQSILIGSWVRDFVFLRTFSALFCSVQLLTKKNV